MVIKSFICYRAELSNGIILENDESDFKSLYRCAVRELKSDFGYSSFFECGYAEISYGVTTEVYEGSYVKASFIEVRRICKIHVFSCDKVTHLYTERW